MVNLAPGTHAAIGQSERDANVNLPNAPSSITTPP
jgi:hypothetical protein